MKKLFALMLMGAALAVTGCGETKKPAATPAPPADATKPADPAATPPADAPK